MSRVGLIPGGSGGLGQAVVLALLQRGDSVAVPYLIPEQADALEKRLGGHHPRLWLTRADVLSPKVLDRVAAETVARFGSLDIMVSLIGGWSGGFDVDEVDDLRWDRALELNLRSAFLAARCAIGHMRSKDWGRLVFVSSRAAREYPGGQAAYNVAKAGVMSLVESLANELRFTGITANCVLPSIIDTEAARQVMPHADFDRWPKTDQIAKVIAWLTSDDAGLVSGASIPVYGQV